MINREINILGKRWEESTNRECHDKKVPSNYLKQIDFASKLFSILQFYSRDTQPTLGISVDFSCLTRIPLKKSPGDF